MKRTDNNQEDHLHDLILDLQRNRRAAMPEFAAYDSTFDTTNHLSEQRKPWTEKVTKNIDKDTNCRRP